MSNNDNENEDFAEKQYKVSNSFSLFPYELELFQTIIPEDSLLVYGKGLGAHRILRQLLSLYSDPNVLVFVLLATAEESKMFVEDLALSGNCDFLPKIITNETPPSEREEVYLGAGVIFITSRILIVDVLNNKVPLENVTGFLVCHADRVNEKSTEAFILRRFRQTNQKGFVKGFSDYPDAFARGFSTIQRIMKCLFLNKLYIKPRFHVDIKEYLRKREPEVIELKIELTESMMKIQNCLMELIDLCLQELKRSNPSLNIETSNGLVYSLDRRIKNQLSGVWHKTSAKTKILVKDIGTLTTLNSYLVEYDCVTFYHYLESLRTTDNSSGVTNPLDKMIWLSLDPTDTLFQQARLRVYSKIDHNKKVSEENICRNLEENPKWELMKELLQEIEIDCKDDANLNGNVLVFVKNENISNQLRDYLKFGGKTLLQNLHQQYLYSKNQLSTINKNIVQNDLPAKRSFQGAHMRRRAKRRQEKSIDELDVTFTEVGDRQEVKCNEKFIGEDQFNEWFGIVSKPNIIIQSMDSLKTPQATERILNNFLPTFILFYDSNLGLTRQVEIYQAANPNIPVRVYFLFYDPSVDEEKYLSGIRREKESLTTLIREKAIMVIPTNQDGRTLFVQRQKGSSGANNKSSRRAGREKEKEKQRIVVDVRELRSELPSLLDSKGVELNAVTLEVGDYILCPEICVERKSVSDLIQSLGSGRLYNQCVAMSATYRMPVLLIEFDEEKSFSLQFKKDFAGEINFNHVTSKLALLTLHFPNLRILWCPSPHNSAELFERLKTTFRQPDPEVAIAVGVDGPQSDESVYNWTAKSLLRKLPGITDQNIHFVMSRVTSVQELVNMSKEEMKALLGPVGMTLYNFCNSQVIQNESKKIKKD